MHLRASIAVLLLIIASGGCAKTRTSFEIQSYRAGAEVERFLEDAFGGGAYAVNATGQWDIVFDSNMPELSQSDASDSRHGPAVISVRFPPTWPSSPSQQESPPKSPELGGGEGEGGAALPTSQYLHIQTHWLPRPGTTFVESSQTNAHIRYCLESGGRVVCYEGEGFVYFDTGDEGDRIKGRLESGTLNPAGDMDKALDLFGRCRVTGQFFAHQDRRRVVNVVKHVERLLQSGAIVSQEITDSRRGGLVR